MLAPYSASDGRLLRPVHDGREPNLLSRKKFMLALPIFVVLTLFAPVDLNPYLRRLTEKCIHNVYADRLTVFNAPQPPSSKNEDVPSYVSMCQEWMKREAGLAAPQRFFRNEHMDVCMDWSAPHITMLDLISGSILASVVPGLTYRHECGRTRAWDEAVIGFDHTTFQQGFPLTNMVADTNVMTVNELKQQCKAVLMDYDPVLERTRRKAYIYHHPFAWPETAGLPGSSVASTTRFLTDEDNDHRRRLQSTAAKCTVIDFDKSGDGSVLTNDHYVRHEWLNKYEVAITATATPGSGYTPQGKARIFDTANPGADDATGDPDLGSPNINCPGGGVGIGAGGEPGKTGENCAPLGNVLIIQESDKRWADDNNMGGTIDFDFMSPMKFESMGFMSIASAGNYMDVKTSDGQITQIIVPTKGYNSVINVEVNMEDVVKVTVHLTKSGAVTGLSFCGFDKQIPTLAPVPIVASPSCNLLDFSVDSTGKALNETNYVKDEFYDSYGGLTVTALAAAYGYTPGGRARIFDTFYPGDAVNGDPDLGSPNAGCPGGGPGIGEGGAPGSPTANCSPLGKAIIIQQSDKSQADANTAGGTITFAFDYPVTVFSIGLLNAEGSNDLLEIAHEDGSTRYVPFANKGANAYQVFQLGDLKVKRLVVHFQQGGAVAGLNICDFVKPRDVTLAPTPVDAVAAVPVLSKRKRQEKIALQTVIPSIISRIGKMASNFKEVTDAPPREEISGLIIYLDVQSLGLRIWALKQYILDSGFTPTSITILVNPLCMTANLPTGQRCIQYADGIVNWLKNEDFPNIGNTGYGGSDGIKVEISGSTAASASRMVRSKLLLCPPSTPACLLPALGKTGGTKAILMEGTVLKEVSEFFHYMGYSDTIKIVEVPDSQIPPLSAGPSTTAYYTTNGSPAAKVFHSVNDKVIGEGYRKSTYLKPRTTLEEAALLTPHKVLNFLKPKIPDGPDGPHEFNPVYTDYRAKRTKNENVPSPQQILLHTTNKWRISNNVRPSREELEGGRSEHVATQLNVDLDVGFATRVLTQELLGKLTQMRKESMRRIGLTNAAKLADPVKNDDPINPGNNLEIFCPTVTEQSEAVTYSADGIVTTDHEDGKLTTISDGGGTVTFDRNTIQERTTLITRDITGNPYLSIADPRTGNMATFRAADIVYNDESGVPKVNGASAVSLDTTNNVTVLVTDGGTGTASEKSQHKEFTGFSVSTGSGRTPGATIIRHENGYGVRWGERRKSKFYGFLPTEARPLDAHSHAQSFTGTDNLLHQDFVPIPIDTSAGNRVGGSLIGGGDPRNRRLDKFILPAETFQFGRDLEQICQGLRADKVTPSGNVEVGEIMTA